MKFFDGANIFNRLTRGRAPVEIHHQVDFIADCLSELAHQLGKVLYRRKAHERLGEGNKNHFQRVVPFFYHGMGPLEQRAHFEGLVNRFHLSTAQMRVHPNLVTDSPA